MYTPEELEQAMSFFKARVASCDFEITISEAGIEYELKKLVKLLPEYVPIGPLDLVPKNIGNEAKKAYQILLEAEVKEPKRLEIYWQSDQFFGLGSLRERLKFKNGRARISLWPVRANESQMRAAMTFSMAFIEKKLCA